MQRAQAGALLQATNQAILQIRQAELNYYVSFYLTFSTQSALIGGFVYSGLTQITFKMGARDPLLFGYFQDAFWIFSAITMAASMHCILTSMFLQVLGPGLALNGPIGSMARAAEGMRKEINHIFLSFIAMTVGFAFSVLASFWAVMTRTSSIAATVVFIVLSMFWWRDCARIYNKFKYNPVESDFLAQNGLDNTGFDALDREYDEETRHRDQNIGKQVPAGSSSGHGGGSAAPSAAASDVDYGDGSTVIETQSNANTFSGKTHTAQSTTTGTAFGSARSGDGSNAAGGAGGGTGGAGPVMKGYLTKREYGNSRSVGLRVSGRGGKYSWARSYFVLTPNGRIFAFHGSKEYNDHPNKPKSDRPLELSWFEASAYCFNDEKAGEVFEIRLEYADKDDNGQPVVFRCDTAYELQNWMTAIQMFTSTCDDPDTSDYTSDKTQ